MMLRKRSESNSKNDLLLAKRYDDLSTCDRAAENVMKKF